MSFSPSCCPAMFGMLSHTEHVKSPFHPFRKSLFPPLKSHFSFSILRPTLGRTLPRQNQLRALWLGSTIQ